MGIAGLTIQCHQLPFEISDESPVLEGGTAPPLETIFKNARIIIAINCNKVMALPARGTSLQIEPINLTNLII